MSVEIEIKGNRIFLTSRAPTPGLGKQVAGANFSRVGGPHWSIPLTMDACRALRERFGKDLRVGTALAEWARKEIEHEKYMDAMGKAEDADLFRVPEESPVLAAAMAGRKYQRAGVRFISDGRNVLVAHQPGLGKTLIALGGIIESGVAGPYLVVCPKTAVRSVWAREIPRWWPNTKVITVPDERSKRNQILSALLKGHGQADADTKTFLVIHPEMIRVQSFWECHLEVAKGFHGQMKPCGTMTPVRPGVKELSCGHPAQNSDRFDKPEFPQLFDIEWGVIVCDESDRMLVRKTGIPTQTRNGAELLRSRLDGLRIAMSGTPFRSRPHLLWGTLNWLQPQAYPAFWRWAETFYQIDLGYGGSRSVGDMRDDKVEDLDRALNRIMIRRTKEEVAPDLPAKTYVGTPLGLDANGQPGMVAVWLPMDPAQKRLYDQMSKESVASLAGGDLNAIGVLAEMTRLKQFATSCGRMAYRPGLGGPLTDVFMPEMPSNKFNYMMELLDELGFPEDPQTKVVIVSQFTQVLELFARELSAKLGAGRGNTISMLTGKVTGTARDEVIQRFNQPVGAGEHLLMLNLRAGGVAITLDSADHMIILDETWVPDDMEQVEDRIHRVSNPRKVFYHNLRSEGSIEEAIAQVNLSRATDSRAVLDARRGVEYARQVLEAL